MAATRDARPAGAGGPLVAAEVALAALPVAVRAGPDRDAAVGPRRAPRRPPSRRRGSPDSRRTAAAGCGSRSCPRPRTRGVRVGVVEPVEEVRAAAAADPADERGGRLRRRRCGGRRGRGRRVRPSSPASGSGASPPAASAPRARRRGSGPATRASAASCSPYARARAASPSRQPPLTAHAMRWARKPPKRTAVDARADRQPAPRARARRRGVSAIHSTVAVPRSEAIGPPFRGRQLALRPSHAPATAGWPSSSRSRAMKPKARSTERRRARAGRGGVRRRAATGQSSPGSRTG